MKTRLHADNALSKMLESLKWFLLGRGYRRCNYQQVKHVPVIPTGTQSLSVTICSNSFLVKAG